MKHLILFRHGDAEHGGFDTPDFNRRLTSKGISDIRRQALTILELGLEPDFMITSNAIRAKATTDILRTICNYLVDILESEFLYHDFTTDQFLNLIKDVDDSVETLIIVGHNPNLSVMGNRLSSNFNLHFKPAGFAVFKTSETWINSELDTFELIHYYE